MTDLFTVAARLDTRAVIESIPPSVRRPLETPGVPQRDGDDVVLELGPWTPRAPTRHVLPSLAVLTRHAPSARFELAARRDGVWSSWVATATLGDHPFPPLPAKVDGLRAEIDEIHVDPPLDGLRLRVRVGGPAREAMFDAPWLVTVSAWDGTTRGQAETARVALAVPPRTQMTESEPIRLRICSPTSVGMAMEFLGREVTTVALADEIFHAPTERFGVWPAAVRVAATHGLPGYLLRFPDWEAVAWCLGRGLPIVASIRYAAGELTNGAMAETDGHLIVITGLDRDEVLVNDPAAPTKAEVARRYNRDEMTRAWLERAGVGYVFLRPI